MALSIQNTANGGFVNSVTSQTVAFNVGSGTDRYLVVGFMASQSVSSVTYAGNSMTQINTVTSPGGVPIYFYGLVNPTSGSNNVVITIGSSGYIGSIFISFNNADQATPIDVSSSETSTASNTVSTAITTVTDGTYTVAFWRDDSGRTVTSNGAGTTMVYSSGGTGYHMARSTNPKSPAGATTLDGIAATSTPTWGALIIAIRPAGLSSVNSNFLMFM